MLPNAPVMINRADNSTGDEKIQPTTASEANQGASISGGDEEENLRLALERPLFIQSRRNPVVVEALDETELNVEDDALPEPEDKIEILEDPDLSYLGYVIRPNDVRALIRDNNLLTEDWYRLDDFIGEHRLVTITENLIEVSINSKSYSFEIEQ